MHLKKLEQINKKSTQFTQFLSECKTTHQLLEKRKMWNEQINKKKKNSNRYQRTGNNFYNSKNKNKIYQFQDDVLDSYDHLSVQKEFLNTKIKQELAKLCLKRQNQQKTSTNNKQQQQQETCISLININKQKQKHFRNQSLELNKKRLNFQYQNSTNLQNPQEVLLKIKRQRQQSQNKERKENIQQQHSKEIVNFQAILLNLKLENVKKYLKFKQTKINKNSSQKQISQFISKLSQIVNLSFLNNQPIIKKYSNCAYFGTSKNVQNFHFGLQYYFESQNLFIGCMKNFKKHGEGIQFIKLEKSQPDFIIYQGTYIKGSKTGNFMVNYPDSVYNGHLVNGKFQGQGVLTTKISTFKGLFSQNQKKYGQQSFIKSGMKYEGQFKGNIFNGSGTLKTDKVLYKGQFVDGQKQGKGLQVTQAYIYEGNFKKNKKNGAGMLFQKGKSQNDIKFVIFEDDQLIQISNQTITEQENKHEQSFQSLKQSSLKTFQEQMSEKTQNQNSYLENNSLNPLKLPQKEKIQIFPQQMMHKQQKQKKYQIHFKYLEGNKRHL